MKEQLNRQIGPFKVWQWLVVVVVGVGIGILVKRRFSSTLDSGPTSPSLSSQEGYQDTLPATQGAPTIVQEDFRDLQALIKGQRDLLAEIRGLQGGSDDKPEDGRRRRTNLPGDPRFGGTLEGRYSVPEGFADGAEQVRDLTESQLSALFGSNARGE